MFAPLLRASGIASLLPQRGSLAMPYWRTLVGRIADREPDFVTKTDDELRRSSRSLQYRARAGESLDQLLVDAYALHRVAAERSLRMRPYDVQLLGGTALHFGSVAEMQTGEGKTLTATLPLYLASLAGQGALLATANDYLAQRDGELSRPLFELLGMRVGIITATTMPSERRNAYACDVVYGTAKEFGFDFLRDRLRAAEAAGAASQSLATMLGHREARGGEPPMQREPFFLLLDEIDNILIDEGRTPLIVSTRGTGDARRISALYLWAAEAVARFDEIDHFKHDRKKRTIELTITGRQLVRDLPKPSLISDASTLELYDRIECALQAEREYLRDRHYVVRDHEIVLVDEFTGRLAEGRRWKKGIHQAVEAKEGLTIGLDSGDAARVTIQTFALRFPRLAGMTGTAASAAKEFKKIFRLATVAIPTNRPPRRISLPERVFGTSEQKWQAIVDEIAEIHQTGRPVLVGTRSIDKSEQLSQRLNQRGLSHQVLNARHLAREAEIITEAGKMGRITVATNMAGRGTDIRLGEGVHAIGGMHVIGTEFHDSQRIDRQLIGRCGRQGDPGSWRQFMALDDEILEKGLSPGQTKKLRALGAEAMGSLSGYGVWFRRAQQKIETEHFEARRAMLEFETQKREEHVQLGQDPYLDAVE
jgi:preprotein translocase subunit SecA